MIFIRCWTIVIYISLILFLNHRKIYISHEMRPSSFRIRRRSKSKKVSLTRAFAMHVAFVHLFVFVMSKEGRHVVQTSAIAINAAPIIFYLWNTHIPIILDAFKNINTHFIFIRIGAWRRLIFDIFVLILESRILLTNFNYVFLCNCIIWKRNGYV